jgi:hypothetical protein
MIFAAAVIVILIFGSAMNGWGLVVRRGFGLPVGTWPATMLLGLSAWVAVGGVLNFFRLAYPAPIYLLLTAGCALTLRALRIGFASFRWTSLKLQAKSVHLTNWIAAFTIIGFVLVIQAAPSTSGLAYRSRLQNLVTQSRMAVNDEHKAVRVVADDGQTVLLQIGADNAL